MTADIPPHGQLPYARSSIERDNYKGRYLVPFGIIENASEDAKREDLAKELWRTTERTLKEFKWM